MAHKDFEKKQEYFTKLYQVYYTPERRAEQERVWQTLCSSYFSKFVPQRSDGVMVDVAAGYCNFINNIKAPNYQKFAYDINESICRQVRGGVKPVVDEVGNLKQHFEPNSVDVFWQSHFLEHLTKDEILQLMRDEYELLKPKGQMWILTPNIRYYKGAFWDWYDHITPLTDRSLMEACQLVGFKPVYVEQKFLAGTLMFTYHPTYTWLMKLYLKLLPFSGWIVGKQSFLVVEKPE